MNIRSILHALAAATLTLAGTGTAMAQTGFPNKAVRIIVPLSAGTGMDTVGRQLAEKLSSMWGQPVVIDNKPGAAGITAISALKQAPADGYTLLACEVGMVAITPQILKRVPFDTLNDLAGVATLFKTYYMLTTAGSGPLDTYPTLVAAAKAKPGQLAYGSTAVGSPAHLAGVLLSDAIQAPMVHVAYKDAGQMFTDVASGQVGYVWATSGSIKPFLDSKRLKVLAAGAPQRLRGYEDIPTVAELGGPKDFSVDNWNAVVALKGTPPDIIAKLNRDISEAMRSPEMQVRINVLGYDMYLGSPADMDRLLASEWRRYGEAVRRAKIEPQ